MAEKKTKINTKWLYPAIISLIVLFLIKFIHLSKIFFFSSLFRLNDLRHNAMDIVSLYKYGLHNSVPNFYNGLNVNFLFYPPGWSFFNLPLLHFFDLTIAVYVSLILVYVLGFISSILIAKYANVDLRKGFFFFVLFFMSPIMFDYVFYIGRFPELFAWMIYTFLLAAILKYKKIDIGLKGMILICILLAGLLLAHPYVSPLGLLLVLSLFLIKGKSERIKIIIILFLAVLLSSFWLIPFFKGMINPPNDVSPTNYQEGGMLHMDSIVSFNTGAIFLWWFALYFYWRSIKRFRKERLFFYPLLLLSCLVFFRISPFLPILNRVPPNSYNLFFLSWSLILFFKTNYAQRIRKLIYVALLLVPIFMCMFVFIIRTNAMRPPTYTSIEEEIIPFFPKIDRFVMINKEGLYSSWEISYAATYYNLSTPQGNYRSGTFQGILDKLTELGEDVKEKKCAKVKKDLDSLNVEYLIVIENCEFLRECGFEEVEKKEYVCLFRNYF